MSLHRLLYRSEADIGGSAAEIQAEVAGIVRASEWANAGNGLTGALVYIRGVFIQAIEGPSTPLEATFEKICCDLRHRRVELLEFMPAAERVFGDWLMVQVTPNLRLEQIVTNLDGQSNNADMPSTKNVIDLMRSMLVTG